MRISDWSSDVCSSDLPTAAPTYLFWRCAPPELRVPQEVFDAIDDIGGILVAVGPHGSATPRAVLQKLGADFVVMGECEETLVRLADGERAARSGERRVRKASVSAGRSR